MDRDHRTVAADERASRRGPRTLAEARGEAERRRLDRARRLQHDQRFDALRTLPARRALVVVGALLVVATAGLMWWDPDGLAGVAGYVAFLAGLGVYLLLGRVLRQADDVPDDLLDERLVAVRNAASRTAYQVLGTVTTVVLLTLMLGVGDAAERRHLEALFLGFTLAAVLAPSAVRAWHETEV